MSRSNAPPPNDITIPPPDKIKASRLKTGWSAEKAATLAGYAHGRAWQAIEAGTRKPSMAAWKLWLLESDQHPTMRLVPR